MAVELLSHNPQLDDEIAGEVLGLSFATLLPPEAKQGTFVFAHDDAGVGTTDEVAAINCPPRFC
jgi:hypothetical protein